MIMHTILLIFTWAGEPANLLSAPAPDFFFQAALAPAPDFFPSGSWYFF